MLAIVGLGGASRVEAQTSTNTEQVLYFTGFEPSEGYDGRYTLTGQNGWVSYGSGGNGIVTNYIQGLGQQAYIGYYPPTNSADQFNNVWRPIDFKPVAPSQSIVLFSVVMEIVDSTSTNYDDFRWSVYNTNSPSANRLFTLDFDNSNFAISYALDDTNGFQSTGYAFTNGGPYLLEITMDFGRNMWSANLNGTAIVDSKPITTRNSPLNLGDVDAVWAIRDTNQPGNNYMLFDNYRVAVEPYSSIQPFLELLSVNQSSPSVVRLHGEAGLTYALEVSTNLTQWESVATNTMPSSGGSLDFTDAQPAGISGRFYRSKVVSP